jgi:hypothetical protein
LPADWSLPGQRPAQDARCPAVGKMLMSSPISATMTSAVRRATPVRLAARATPVAKGAQLFLDRFGGGDLGSQPALGKIGQDLRVGGAGDERVEHRAPGRAEDVGGDAVELDAGVFQRLVQPVGLALALGDLRLALPRQGSQLALRLGRYEAAAQRAGFDELTQPLRVADVGLATRNLLDVPRVAQRQFEVVFEDVPDQTGYQ